jgi:hypothetical protein
MAAARKMEFARRGESGLVGDVGFVSNSAWRVFFVLAVAMSVSARAGDFNAIVLRQVGLMPEGGGYSVTREAHSALNSAVDIGADGVEVSAGRAVPSYCSGATYLVFLKALREAHGQGLAGGRPVPWEALRPRASADGVGIWGRWNANGPGTARLFHELGLGENFTDYGRARSGDFLKIFWNDAVGKKERGHLVVFLGMEEKDGVPHVRFWSSNKPNGYGAKSVPVSSVKRAIFSRVTNPAAIADAGAIPKRDAYLAGLLQKESNFAEALRMSGVGEGDR